MELVLNNVSGFAAVYLNNVVLNSDGWEQHLEYLHIVFGCLHSAGLMVNPSKCVFAASETEYLGHVIGKGIIRPQVSKAVECPLPWTRKQLCSFLALAGLYCRFSPQFSTMAAQLTDLMGSWSIYQV